MTSTPSNRVCVEKRMESAIAVIADTPKPIISAINGICVAGGLEMVLGTDIRIASENAEFGQTEVRWFMVPAGGGNSRLPRAVPRGVAMEMLLTAERVTAQQALQWGLVTHLVPQEELMPLGPIASPIRSCGTPPWPSKRQRSWPTARWT